MEKTFYVDSSSIYGRSADKEAIVQRLLSVDEANSNALQVISIMGMGGIGKTLLTELVYGDCRVQEWFDVKVWVCAAAKFDLLKLAKDILDELNSNAKRTCDQLLVLDELKEKFMGKRFFLVLDDVWNDNEAEWKLLLVHLQAAGAQGSKIIVTTRSESVASALGAVQSHVLSELSDDDCWRLFAKHAFNDDNENHRGLEMIGREIVRKCGGLPLIAKMLGDVLCCENNVEEWQKISDNMELCSNYIFMILKLTHIDLLFHLKQCLAYGIKSPKDYAFVKEKLVLSWIEGVRSRENKRFDYFGSRDIIIQDLAISVQCPILGRENEVVFEWGAALTNIILETLLLIFDQIASPRKPHYALMCVVVSLAAIFICITELVYKGQKQKITLMRRGMRCWLHFPSSDNNPYTIMDVLSFVSAISQFIYSSIGYSYIRRGSQNPIKVCFVPVIFIICTASSNLIRKPNETRLPISRED